MDKIIKQFSNSLVEIKIDDSTITEFSNSQILFGEKIELIFDNSTKMILQTFELPHKYGESDIEFDFLPHQQSMENNITKTQVKTLRIYKWKASGINLLGLTKYLVQIEIKLVEEKSISIGFFYLKNDEVEFLATGELAISFNYNIFKSFNNNNLSYYEKDYMPDVT